MHTLCRGRDPNPVTSATRLSFTLTVLALTGSRWVASFITVDFVSAASTISCPLHSRVIDFAWSLPPDPGIATYATANSEVTRPHILLAVSSRSMPTIYGRGESTSLLTCRSTCVSGDHVGTPV